MTINKFVENKGKHNYLRNYIVIWSLKGFAEMVLINIVYSVLSDYHIDTDP